MIDFIANQLHNISIISQLRIIVLLWLLKIFKWWDAAVGHYHFFLLVNDGGSDFWILISTLIGCISWLGGSISANSIHVHPGKANTHFWLNPSIQFTKCIETYICLSLYCMHRDRRHNRFDFYFSFFVILE